LAFFSVLCCKDKGYVCKEDAEIEKVRQEDFPEHCVEIIIPQEED